MLILEEKEKKKYNFVINLLKKIGKKEHHIILTVLYDLYITSKKTKYEYLDTVFNNCFISPDQKEEYERVFSLLQGICFSISRFIYMIKYKKAQIYNTTDLLGDPFNGKNQMTIFENNTKYIFQIRELIQIMNTSLANSVHFFSEPIPCKNPYTNIPFHKSSLYNIYFRIKKSAFVMPILLQQFFLSNFDLTTYAEENEYLIRNQYLESYSNNITAEELSEILNSMFEDCNLCSRRIHRDFPKDRLLKIMRPYIHLYYKSKYSFQYSKQHFYLRKLKMKLEEFVDYNPHFGRKKVICKYSIMSNKKIIDRISFNDDHIHFNKKEKKEDFIKSHLLNDPDSYLHIQETDSEDEDDY